MAASIGGVVWGAGRPKIVVPLTGADAPALLAQAAAAASTPGVDLVEWRLDRLASLTPDAAVGLLPQLRDVLGGLPILGTFRTAAEGGAPIEPDAYVALNRALIDAGVDAVDVEHAFDEASGDAILDAADARGIGVVGSSHDLDGTPKASEIVTRLAAMSARGMAVAKIAVTPRTPDDVLTLLAATRAMAQVHPGTPVIAIAMGGLGVITRLAGQVFGSCATFATVGDASAPGQLPVAQVRDILDLIAVGLDRP